MWTRVRLNSISGSGLSVGQDSAAGAAPADGMDLPLRICPSADLPICDLPLRFVQPLLLLFSIWAFAVWASGAPTSLAQLPIAPTFCDQGCAIADLDGDGRPDLAVAKLEGWGPSGFRYRIDLDLTSRAGPSSFSVFAQRGGLRITPRDVNGDWELDLIISSAWSYTPIGVWINDGHGGFVRSDPTLDLRPGWEKGPRVLSDSSGEVFQATVPEFSRTWPDYSKGPAIHNEVLTQHLTPQLCDVLPPNGSARRWQTRGPPLWFWQPGSSAKAHTA